MSRPWHVLHVFATFGIGGPQMRAAQLMARMPPPWRHSLIAMDGETSCEGHVAPGIDLHVVQPPAAHLDSHHARIHFRPRPKRRGADTTNGLDPAQRLSNDRQRAVGLPAGRGDHPLAHCRICASEDRSSKRFWKRQTLIEAVPIEDLEAQLPHLLQSAWEALKRWAASDLAPA